MYREQYGGYVYGYSSVKCWSVWTCMKMNQSSSSWWDNLQSNLSNVSKFLTGLPPCVPRGGEGRVKRNTKGLASETYLNILTPMSDQDRISPYNINTVSSRQVMRINKKVN